MTSIIENITPEEIKAELAGLVYGEETWQRIHQLNLTLSTLLMPSEEMPYGEWVEEKVEPETLAVGDYLARGGYVCQIETIQTFKNDYDENKPIFVFKCTYVGGNLSEFLYFKESINNGCAYGHRSHEQGNAYAGWHKLTKAN